MSTHVLELERRTLHGHWSRDLPPVLTIDPGDTVRMRTLDAGWGLENYGISEGERMTFAPRDAQLDEGHALCGPIAVRGAMPGMTLCVRVDRLRPATWGWTLAAGWPSEFNERMGVAATQGHVLTWALDLETMTGWDQHGRSVALRPFLGVIGMPPPEPGVHSTTPPRAWGGNIDCKELVTGSTLYLPIPVPGALLSAGDGHAAQGDGEVSGLAIECPMDEVELTIDLRDDWRLRMPRAHTPAGWLTLGFHPDLNEAMYIALEGMLDLLTDEYGLQRDDALALASVGVDLRISQIVNGSRGVHAVLPHGAIGMGEREP